MEMKLREVEKTERLNNKGIMIGSILTVHVVEARDLKPVSSFEGLTPYVELEIEGQRIETSVKSNTVAPVWNESFTFDIELGTEPLKITVLS